MGDVRCAGKDALFGSGYWYRASASLLYGGDVQGFSLGDVGGRATEGRRKREEAGFG